VFAQGLIGPNHSNRATLMQFAPVLAAVTAAIVGCGGSIAIVLAAAESLKATEAETASWITAVCFAIAASTAILSVWHRLPLITAWSTPGAALIAAAPTGLDMTLAVGAFLVAAGLILLSSLIAPLLRLIERIPSSVAAGMLAGVLLRLVTLPFEAIPASPWLILPLLGLFLVARRLAPSLAVIGVLVVGVALAWGLEMTKPLPALAFAAPVWIMPRFEMGAMIGLGVPLFLVTMASQNLAGFAVLRAAGYGQVPSRSILSVTAGISLLTAPFGTHTSNLAAISAAICTGPDAHKDPARRWLTGPPYALCYLVFAALGPSLVALFATLPSALIKTVAGVALAGPLVNALSTAFTAPGDRFAPGLAFAVTASGIVLFGIGAAFWGLLAGLIVVGLERLTATR
jgi:benzoate membrane transport protein